MLARLSREYDRRFLACGTTEVVPFPVVALPKFSEGWGCGIPPFAKYAKDGAPSVPFSGSKKSFIYTYKCVILYTWQPI